MTTLSQIIDNEDMQKITSEFSRLGDRCYLENAGSSLYPQCLIKTVNEDLTNNLYMNPHSDKYTKDCIDQIKCLILEHFNTDSSNYTVVFTSGCTQSLKLIVESFQFANEEDDLSNCGSFVYLQDNHTSVLGLREIAIQKTPDIIHMSHNDFLKALKDKQVTPWNDKYNKKDGNTLFVYPAQNNFNGFKYPIDCMASIRDGCLNNHIMKYLCKINCNWYIMLDAATYVSTSKLDLSVDKPDFVCMSFYKIFGFPTGLGAVLVKNSSEAVLNNKKYFGGGTVDIVLSSENFHVKRSGLHERFEDGTVSFLSIIALKHCFDTMHRLIPKVVQNDMMETISLHTFCLAKDLYNQLSDLRHPNGCKAAILYMDSDFSHIKQQGGCVTFNLRRQNGAYIGYAEFQHMADLFSISVRTGCFCNSGSCQRHLSVSNKEMKHIYKAGHKCGDDLDLIDGRPTGAVRVSFGYFNTFNDVDKLMQMICHCFVKTQLKISKRQALTFKAIEMMRSKVTNGDMQHIYEDIEHFTESIADRTLDDTAIQLKEMAIFPIKSCGAFKVKTAWNIGPKGFEYDREWMIIKDSGVCMTQKQNTRMCMIHPTVDLLKKRLILNFKGKQPISVPLEPLAKSKLRETTVCQSKVCTDMVKGYDCGDQVANWISEACEVSYLRLIRQANDDKRAQKKKKSEDGQKLLSLSNQAQFLLINKATVRWLKEKIVDEQFKDDIDKLTDRFRGNIIIDMDTELAELDWQKLIIGRHEFKVEGQCPRCQMVCIDQQTGEKTVEPLRTIAEQFAGKLRFGIYLTYMGTIDGSKDPILQTSASVTPIVNDDNISR